MGVDIEWIEDRERFAAIADAWDDAARQDPDPFLRHAWVASWWDAYAAARDVRIAVVWDGEQLVAALPLVLDDDRAVSFSFQEMAPWRPLARAAAGVATVVGAALALPAAEVTMHSALVDDPHVALMARQAVHKLRPVRRTDPNRFLAVETTGRWEDYRARMKSRWGSIERKTRKMARDHDAQLRYVEPPDDLEATLEAGYALEAKGWKGRAGSAMLDQPEQAEFVRLLARAFAESGDVRVSEIVLDGTLVAWDLAILHRGRLHSLKTAYDEEASTLSPGLVLRRAIVERCFDLGLEGHELLGPDMEWKRRFATSARMSGSLHLERPRPKPLARLVYQRVKPILSRGASDGRGPPERWPPPPLR